MIELLKERRDLVQEALGQARLRKDTLEAQLEQAKHEIDQLAGALLELNHLVGLISDPGGPPPRMLRRAEADSPDQPDEPMADEKAPDRALLL